MLLEDSNVDSVITECSKVDPFGKDNDSLYNICRQAKQLQNISERIPHKGK